MSDADNNQQILTERPVVTGTVKPHSPGLLAAVGAVAGPVFLGVSILASMALSKIPYVGKSKYMERITQRNKLYNNVVDYGLSSGAGAVIGYMMGQHYNHVDALRTDARQLQEKVEALEADRDFTRALLQKDIDRIKSESESPQRER